MLRKRLLPSLFVLNAVFTLTPAWAQFVQQGNKLVASDYAQTSGSPVSQGTAVAVSTDGNTMIVGAKDDNGGIGAAWIYTRTSGVWTQQGTKLTASDATGTTVNQGASVALSGDGLTALVGGPSDNGQLGAAWVYVNTNGVWSQQGSKLVDADLSATAGQGSSVALSSDGNTALIGAPNDGSTGSALVFTRSAGVWTQPADKLVGTGSVATAPFTSEQGRSVAITTDGTTAIIGGPGDNQGAGAVWIFTCAAGACTQQGGKLVGTGSVTGLNGYVFQGSSVAISSDGNTALVGAPWDNSFFGAAWVFTRSGTSWSQPGPKLVPAGGGGAGAAVALSADGITALIGMPGDSSEGVTNAGAAWIFTRTGNAWSPQDKLFGSNAAGTWIQQGASVALSSDASTAVLGGPGDNSTLGAAWVFVPSPGLHFVVSAPDSAVVGTPFNFTVTAKDTGGNTITAYAGTVHFTSTDTSAVLPSDAVLSSGTGTFQATLETTGSQTITATDTVTASVAGTSASIAVSYAVHFAVSAQGSATPGTAFNFTVTAQDSSNTTITGYSGTVHFTSTDGAAVLPLDAKLVNGTRTFSATLKTPGNQTIHAADTAVSSTTGTSGTIVVAAWTAAHFLVSAPALATPGTAFTFTFTVTAQDSSNNTNTAYSGTVHFSSTDLVATLPVNATLTNGTGTFTATLKTAGSQSLTAADLVTPSIAGNSGAISVTAGAATHLAVSAPSTATAGTSISITVTAQDAYNNTSPTYTGTVHFTSSDAAAALPSNVTLANGTGSVSATLKTAGSQTISANDLATSSIAGTSGTVSVAAAGVTRLAVVAPASAVAGTAFNITVTAQDAYSNTTAGYTGTVHFISSDAAATPPANSTLTSGIGTFSVTLKTAGSQTITATDTVTSALTGTSGAITVAGGATTRLVVLAQSTATAGTAFNVTVTAQDANNNTVTGYAGTVHFSSSDAAAVLPANATLASGTGTFPVTLKTAGSQTITATDTVTAAIAGTTGAIVASAAAATHYALSAPANAPAGTAFNLTVTAKDSYNNTATAYAGTVHLASSDAAAVLPSNSTLTSGTGTLAVTLKTAGNQSLTATDTVTASITGTVAALPVSAAAATHLTVTAPATASAGASFSFTVTALDAYNNTSTAYAGTVHFTSTDTAALLPANATLTAGTAQFPATLKTTGSQTLTATDTVTASITGTSAAISVAIGPAAHFAVSAPASAPAGTAFNFTVTAQDAGNNLIAAYAGTVHFTSSASAALLPANATLTNGTATFPATLKTAGNQSLTATDTVTSTITGTSAAVAVAAGTATHLVVSAPALVAAGTAFSLAVTAQDAFNNTSASYAGTVHFTSTDLIAGLPPGAALTNGVGAFTATLKTAGTQSITAADKATAAIAGTSAAIGVAGGAATHFAVSAPASANPGTSFSFTVTALDAYNNVSTGYAGTMQCTSSDPSAVLPTSWMLSNGTGTFSATLATPGSQTITASDTAAPSITGVSAAIVVGGGTVAVSADPGSGNSASSTMTFTFSDPRGWQDLDVVNVLINNFLDGRNACYLAYSRTASVLYLVNDSGNGLLPALALNGSGTLGNSQCTVTGAGSSVAGSGNVLTLTLNLSFSAGFAGNKITYLAARDLEGGNSGWQGLGTWGVPGSNWSGPEVMGAAPARSSGTGTQMYTFTFADTNGWQDLGVVDVLINDSLNGYAACYLAYSRPGNVLYLVNDAGTALSPGLTPDGTASVSNGQCTVSGVASGSGNTLTLMLNVTFTPSFAGNRLIYLAARSNGDLLNSGWQAVGSRTVQ